MNFRHPNSTVGFHRRVFAIAQFTFNFHVSALLQHAGLFRQFAPADDAMPFWARLVLGAALLLPTDARSE